MPTSLRQDVYDACITSSATRFSSGGVHAGSVDVRPMRAANASLPKVCQTSLCHTCFKELILMCHSKVPRLVCMSCTELQNARSSGFVSSARELNSDTLLALHKMSPQAFKPFDAFRSTCTLEGPTARTSSPSGSLSGCASDCLQHIGGGWVHLDM
eukprot:5609848-Amphidinium_carterae.2